MFFLPENLIKGQETKRGEKRGGKRKGVEWRLDKKRRLLFPFMASCSGMDGWYIGDRNGSWFSLGALPFRTLSFSLSLGLVSVFCSNCAGDKSGSHYRVDVFLESLFLAFQPSHSQAHILSLSLSGKVQNCSCRRGAFFLLCIFLISSSDLKSPPCLFFF